MVPEMTVEELKSRMDSGDDLVLIDVREPHEQQFCRIDPCTLIRMSDIPARHSELDRDRDVVIYCRSGSRSSRVVQYLRAHGFGRVYNLQGGILAWIDRIDPTQPKY